MVLPPKGSFFLSISISVPINLVFEHATNKDQIEKLESKMQELKESM